MIKIINSADMRECGEKMQAAIDDAQSQGAKLLQIVHNLPQAEDVDIKTFLIFKEPPAQEDKK